MEKYCTLLLHYDRGVPPKQEELIESLEKGDVTAKQQAMKDIVALILNGEVMPKILMTVIRFVMPHDDHMLKKLLLLYWEVVEKVGPDGKLMTEMILVCNNLRNDLSHPNEYIRGSTLRFLCKLKEPELLEPLIPVIKQNLEHRVSFVRRNAVLSMFAIYKNFEYLLPDAPDLIYAFLNQESDGSSKRNAFLMLFHCAQDRAVDFLIENIDQVASFPDILQLVVLELIRKVCRANPLEKSRYIKCILALFQSPSNAVVYECATSLVALSSSPTAIRAATSSYTRLLESSDHNIKLIVLERLVELKRKHGKVLEEQLMDILRILASPNMDIRRKVLDIALDLVGPRNVEEVVHVLKKEVLQTQQQDDKNVEYRQLLIGAIHQCAVKFSDIAQSVVHVLMDFLGDSNTSSAVDVILFVREIVEAYPKLRVAVVSKLVEVFDTIQHARVFRVALWILGEYSEGSQDIATAFQTIKASLGDLPFITDDDEEEGAATETKKEAPVVLADGTYASQAATETASKEGSTLRTLLLEGDFFLATVIANSLTKLALRAMATVPDAVVGNYLAADVMLICCGMLKLGKSPSTPQQMDSDAYERICTCLHVLSNPTEAMKGLWLEGCRKSFSDMMVEKMEAMRMDEEAIKASESTISKHADDLIIFRQLRSRKDASADLDDDDGDLNKAMGTSDDKADSFAERLNRVTQLTGLSDPVYAEACTTVHQYDIVLDILVINQTSETMQNLCVELATVGDLKLCERPQNHTLGAGDSKQIKCNIKVSSTETGIVFGSIVYDACGPLNSERNCVILNDIHIDIMDYIAPATTTDLSFRSMWAEFEWENKVAVNTAITNVKDFLNHIVTSTNMKCLTPTSSLEGEAGFLAANLYAKSIFGEDALVNVSVEQSPVDGRVGGYIRIRSKTQGIALSLGDKITLKQKG